MRRATYADKAGRYTVVLLPDEAPDGDAYMGIPVGPPPLDDLGLPGPMQTRLHNELFARGLLSVRDVRLRRSDVLGALMSALKVDADSIVALYERHYSLSG